MAARCVSVIVSSMAEVTVSGSDAYYAFPFRHCVDLLPFTDYGGAPPGQPLFALDESHSPSARRTIGGVIGPSCAMGAFLAPSHRTLGLSTIRNADLPLNGRPLVNQSKLSAEQIEPFYHEGFVADQTRHFLELVGHSARENGVVTDVGGGCGFFAKKIAEITGRKVKVIDTDADSLAACKRTGIDAKYSDALNPDIVGDEDIVTFNLILHHLVGRSEQATRGMQTAALAAWRRQALAVFVNEYVYDSYWRGLSGWLMYQITKSRVLSWIGRAVSIVVPSLKANTFGVGVRFRGYDEWVRLFESAGYEVKKSMLGDEDQISVARRLLLIKAARRDSFLLIPRAEGVGGLSGRTAGEPSRPSTLGR